MVELKKSKDLGISKPDKGNATVIQNKCDCVEKMECILGHGNSFKKNTEDFYRTILGKILVQGHMILN